MGSVAVRYGMARWDGMGGGVGGRVGWEVAGAKELDEIHAWLNG